jgi:uncharacterized membrane protein YphA (DoxX/SURF4 family)
MVVQQFLAPYEHVVLFVVRVVLGATMVYYGRFKLADMQENARNFAAMGFRPGWLFGSVGATVEFFGGILVVAGLFVDVVAAVFAGQMLVGTVWKIRQPDKPFTDWSYDVLLGVLCAVVITFGPGAWTLVSLL